MLKEIKKPNMQDASSRELAEEMLRILYQKGAMDIQMFKVDEDSALTDYHIIVTGRVSTHVKALSDDLEYEMEERGVKARAVEGRNTGAWVLLDYYRVLVHIFDEENRSYYHLERLQKAESLVDITLLVPASED